MYSETDLDAAVTAGVLTPEATAHFRTYIAGLRTAPAVDEEYFRLITGFNDIFVTIAIALVLGALAFLGGQIGALPAALLVTAASWPLAEYFTRRRRMALPSIVLLLGFVGGIAATATALIALLSAHGTPIAALPASLISLVTIAAAIVVAFGSYLHWRRFHVPITVAAGTAGAIGFALGFLLAIAPPLREYWQGLLALCGVGVFGLALRWDMSDRARTSRRSDVAFWLHLLAAPLIVHPIFAALGLLNPADTGISRALAAIGIYIVLALVALLVDRRALLVSALFYVIYALAHVFHQAGGIGSDLALTALVVGVALLLLSASWHTARAALLRAAPAGLRRRLPA